jgi:mevalonate kinase
MIASICQSKGQLHAKLTGAGGGGFAFALVSIWKNIFSPSLMARPNTLEHLSLVSFSGQVEYF